MSQIVNLSHLLTAKVCFLTQVPDFFVQKDLTIQKFKNIFSAVLPSSHLFIYALFLLLSILILSSQQVFNFPSNTRIYTHTHNPTPSHFINSNDQRKQSHSFVPPNFIFFFRDSSKSVCKHFACIYIYNQICIHILRTI